MMGLFDWEYYMLSAQLEDQLSYAFMRQAKDSITLGDALYGEGALFAYCMGHEL